VPYEVEVMAVKNIGLVRVSRFNHEPFRDGVMPLIPGQGEGRRALTVIRHCK
jgi:hypothetical protein